MAHNAGNLSIQQILERATNANPGGRGGGLLLIEAPGEPARTYVAGRRVRGGSAPVTPETPFGLASITKTMVAALALIYAERGLIDLDAPALEMVPDTDWLLRRIDRRAFRRNLEAATVRELLAHRSGLPDYWDNHAFHRAWRRDMARKWEPLDLVAYGGAMRPECAPGRCFEYSDTNFVIMGLLLEHRFGRPLHALLREEIFAPLGMRCTWMFFEEPAPASCPPVAHSYETRLDVTANRLQSADWAGGGLYSTLADQKRFLDALFVRRSLLGEAGMAALTDWQASGLGHGVSYGLGLYRIELGRGRTLVGHFGVHNAFSFVWVETGTVITGSLNQENNDASHSLLQPLLERLAARTERESVRE